MGSSKENTKKYFIFIQTSMEDDGEEAISSLRNDDSFKENEQSSQIGTLDEVKSGILNFDAPKFYNFSKPKYQKYLQALEKVLFPSSSTNSSFITSPAHSHNNSIHTSDNERDDDWFDRVHSGHETSQIDTPHPLISPSPPKNDNSSQKVKKTFIKGSPVRVTATSQTSEQSQVSFSTPMMFMRSPAKFSPIVKSPLNGKFDQINGNENELLDSGLIKFLPQTKITANNSPKEEEEPDKKNHPRLSFKSFLDDEEEVFSDTTPIAQKIRPFEAGQGRNILSYSPSPPKLATHLSSSSNNPSPVQTAPFDLAPKKLISTKAQRVLTGINLNNRKRRSSSSETSTSNNGLFNVTRNVNTNNQNGTSVFSNHSTPSKAVKKIKVDQVDYCPPIPSIPPAQQTHNHIFRNNTSIATKKPQVKMEDLRKLLNEHNKRVKNNKK
jgi:hypothetical protein